MTAKNNAEHECTKVDGRCFFRGSAIERPTYQEGFFFGDFLFWNLNFIVQPQNYQIFVRHQS